MLHSSSGAENKVEDICFLWFTALHVEHLFAGIIFPSNPTLDMHDYASRRPSCIIESVQQVYDSSFLSRCMLDLRATDS